jgi:hypothetical protein
VLDARLRQLARRWAESRDPADAARLTQALTRSRATPLEVLHERVRLDLFPAGRFELACYVGSPLAIEVLEGSGEPLPDVDAEVGDWVRGLGYWGKEAVVRAAVAAARPLLPRWEARQPDELRPAEALAAADAWVACPCETHAARALAAAQACWLLGDAEARGRDADATRVWDAAWPTPIESGRAEAITSATGSAAYAARADSDAAASWAENAATAAAEALGAERLAPTAAVVWSEARELGAATVREAIRDAVGAWALA